MKQQFLRETISRPQNPYYHYKQNNTTTSSITQQNIDKYREQLKQLAQQEKPQILQSNDYEKQLKQAQVIKETMQQTTNWDSDDVRYYQDQFSKPKNENEQRESEKQINNLMNKFYEIDMPNLDNISIKTLMTNLSGVN